jgi:hypothetical protein
MADSYNYDMQRLQQDAIRRAREMQARAQSYVAPPPPAAAPANPSHSQNREPAKPEQARHIPPAEPRHTPRHEPPPPEPNPPLNPLGNIFEGLMKDSERTLILVLILLLVEEKSNPEVIFALMYLIL